MKEAELARQYFEYDPGKDPSGIKGAVIAERVLRLCNYDFKQVDEWVKIIGKGLYFRTLAEEREIRRQAILQ